MFGLSLQSVFKIVSFPLKNQSEISSVNVNFQLQLCFLFLLSTKYDDLHIQCKVAARTQFCIKFISQNWNIYVFCETFLQSLHHLAPGQPDTFDVRQNFRSNPSVYNSKIYDIIIILWNNFAFSISADRQIFRRHSCCFLALTCFGRWLA